MEDCFDHQWGKTMLTLDTTIPLAADSELFKRGEGELSTKPLGASISSVCLTENVTSSCIFFWLWVLHMMDCITWHYKLNSNPKSLLVRILIKATELKTRSALLCARLFFFLEAGEILKKIGWHFNSINFSFFLKAIWPSHVS